MHTLCVWCQDSYLLQCFQAVVHSQRISQGSASRTSDSILSKTMKESTPELVQVEKIKWDNESDLINVAYVITNSQWSRRIVTEAAVGYVNTPELVLHYVSVAKTTRGANDTNMGFK